MRTFYKSLLTFLIVFAVTITYPFAQICVNATMALDADGKGLLDVEEILNFTLQPGQSAFVLPAYFTCENVYEPTPVTVYLIDNGDTVYLCKQDVIVLDSHPPVARCRSNIHVQLNENGEYRFAYADVNDGSYDLCTEVVAKTFFPDRIRCTDPNPMNVMMVVRDLAGNVDTCTVEVSYDDYTGNTDPISCRDTVKYYFFPGDEYAQNVGIRNVLKHGSYGCSANYSIDLYDGPNLRPDDSLTIDDEQASLTAILTDLVSTAQCSTVISVIIAHDPCESVPATLCDTKCHSTPFGDCASGHSDEDAVELPCDVYIADWCAMSHIYPDPEFIVWYGYPQSDNAWPTSGFEFITPEDNVGHVFVGFWDTVVELPAGKQVIRNWTILDWCTQETIDYIQNIFVSYDLTEICDSLPWNEPAGDCQSGHTLTDDVEWPADITIHSFFSHPDDLALNPEVKSENVEPRLNRECLNNAVTYDDVVTEANDTTIVIERTWSVIDWYSVELWQYVQIITVIHETLGSVVCVTTENGQPIPGVELITGVTTDDTGCHAFPDPEGIIVNPVKDSPLQAGVNILDLIILWEDLLGINNMSFYQNKAADINNSHAVSAIDVVEFNKLLWGNFSQSWTHNWRFYEQNTQEGSADISDPSKLYKFIGVKMGDLDNSYIAPVDFEDIILRTEDDVLNAGETYAIPFYLERNETLAGFAIQLKNENNSLELMDITSPDLPGFDPAKNVGHAADAITVQWVSPAQFLLEGVEVDTTASLFILHVRANENIILSEHLTLEALFDNILKPSGDDTALDIRLAWEDIVINSVVKLDNGRQIEFYPNPASGILHFKGLTADDRGKIMLMDPTGRTVFEQNIQAAIDIGQLQVGMYYMYILFDGNQSPIVPLVKI